MQNCAEICKACQDGSMSKAEQKEQNDEMERQVQSFRVDFHMLMDSQLEISEQN